MLTELHKEATGQVAIYQNNGRYEDVLGAIFGARFSAYRARWHETSSRGSCGDFPLSLDLAINSGCQLHCRMCPMARRPRAVRLMTDGLFHRLMDQAREHGLPAMTLGLASEPLLNPKAGRHIAYAVKSGVMDIRLGTNGAALSERNVAELIDCGLTRLEISVDAATASTYNAIRGGDLDELERKIDLFLNTRLAKGSELPLLRLSFLRLEENKSELDDFIRRWGSLADMISIQQPIWFPGSDMPKPASGRIRPQAPLCSQSWQRLGIDYDGHAWPCCSWYGETLLSLSAAELNVAEIWRSQEMEVLRRNLAGPGESYPPQCRECCF